ncbi:Small nuclear ribonucleoprotein [Aspergillus sp. HF37]|nr:Small nuclear ribonucleoprotein [Aspergillus sp. HF37]
MERPPPPHDNPPQHGNGQYPPQNTLGPSAPMMSQGPPQLPPQMFTTAAQLLDLTDKKLVLVLRDGRKLIGVLRSWDQFGNLVLQDTIERLYVANLYADVPRGIFLVRGENVSLLGEIDLDREDELPPNLQRAPFPEVFQMKQKEDAARKQNDRRKHNKLQGMGFEPEHSGEILF